MVDGIPLRQVLEPGKYRVEWAVPIVDGNPKQITGDIELKADGAPTGWVYGGIPLNREHVDPNVNYGVLGVLPRRVS